MVGRPTQPRAILASLPSRTWADRMVLTTDLPTTIMTISETAAMMVPASTAASLGEPFSFLYGHVSSS